MTHSPGPWRWGGDETHGAIGDANGLYVCELSDDSGCNVAANARLIAAAPELLVAVRSLLLDFATDDPKTARARALITRIEGET